MVTTLERPREDAAAGPSREAAPVAPYAGNKPLPDLALTLLEDEAKRLERIEAAVRLFPQA
jgi:hypothetical protein